MSLSLTAPVKNAIFVAWLALMAGTLFSWYLGDGHGAQQFATVGILVIAFLKAYVVGRYFMELREAPKLLHAIFAGWCFVICSVLATLYLVGGG